MKEKFREIFEKSPIGIIFFDMEGNLTDANLSALEIMGIPSLKDVIGFNMFDDLNINSKKEELLENRHIKFQTPVDFDYIKKIGAYNPTHFGRAFIYLTISVINSGFLMQIQDINEQKKVEEKLKYESNLLDNVNDPIIATDLNRIITSWNKAAEKLYGYKAEEAMGKLVNDVIRSEFSDEQRKEALKHLSTGNEYSLNVTQYTKKGEPVFIEATTLPIYINDKITGYVAVNHDITKRKKAEEALIESEKRYSELFNSMSEMFQVLELIYDDNGRAVDFYYRDVNPATEKLLNRTRNQIVGKRAKELFGTVEDYWIQALSQVNETKEPMHIDNYSVELDKYYDVNSFKVEGQNKVAIVFTDITERRKAEEELRKAHDTLEEQVKERTMELEKAYQTLKENEVKYRSLYENAPVGIFHSTLKGKYIDVNPELARILGYNSPEDLISTVNKSSIHDIIYVNKEIRPEFLKSVLKAKDWFRTENLHRRKDGKIIIGDISFRNVGTDKKGNQLLEGFMTDITARKEAKKALELIINYNRSLIETSLDPLVTIGPDGKITDVNGATEVVTGYSRDELIGTYFSDYFTEPQKASEGYQKVFRDGEVRDYELEIRHKKGLLTPVLYNASVYKDKFGKVIGVFAAARDITRIKEAEIQLKETIKELEHSNKELQQFAYISSHDLQEPLRTIASFTQLLQRRYEGKFDSDADEFMEYIVEAAIRMKEQIEGLLEYSRVGTKDKEFKPVNMNEILSQTIRNLKVLIEESNAKITFDELPNVIGDDEQLQRVFQNLISNAIRFRKCEEPLKIHISATKDKENNEYIFSVSDNGIGIEEQYSERIFTIFQRLHTREVYKGTGIGLSIVKRIIERHNGRIWVESEFGAGSTFYFTIPIRN